MEWKKNVNTNLGITIILVFAALFTIIDFYIVGSELDGYPFNDLSDEVVIEDKDTVVEDKDVLDKNVVEDENVKIVKEGQLIFDGISIDDLYRVGDKQYHIVTDNNKVVVDAKDVFSTTDELFKIRLYNDILLIQVKKSSGVDLFFADMSGNIIKKIENVKHVDVYNSDILYSLEVIGSDGVNMFESSSRNINKITYLGNYNFSDVVTEKYYQPGCDTSDYCMIYDKNGLKVEYISDHLEHSKINSHYSLFVNGKNVEIGVHLSSIFLLSDNYLLVSSSYMDGWSNFINIVDSNGDVVVDFDDYMNEGEYTAHHLVSGDNVYNDGEITVYGVIANKFDRYYEDSCSAINDDKSAIISKKHVFRYLGNGKIDNGTVVKEITLGDWAAQLDLSYCNH